MDTAYFVQRPRTIDDLRKPHPIREERPYEVIGRITLAGIDYENFITDMRVSRPFIKDHGGPCAEGARMRCLFVRRRGSRDGILVVPAGKQVGWAAHVPEYPAL